MPGGLAEAERIAVELRELRGGVADTSTLIYLERLGLLPQAARAFTLVLIPQVIGEYGSLPPGTVPVTAAPDGPTDQALWRMARQLGQPVFSEDRQVLRAARTARLSSYNTLLLLLSLLARGEIHHEAYAGHRQCLLSFARYSRTVVAVGEAVFQVLEPSLEGRGY